MSDTDSDVSDDLELELTAEELEEAKQRLLEKKKETKKTTGDIVIDLDDKRPKSKKYLPPEEFGIQLIHQPIGKLFHYFRKLES